VTTAWTDLMENDKEALRDRVGDLGKAAMRRSDTCWPFKHLLFMEVYVDCGVNRVHQH
jgi:hypothetical protein